MNRVSTNPAMQKSLIAVALVLMNLANSANKLTAEQFVKESGSGIHVSGAVSV